jgi:hypothetical protein
MGGGIFGRPVPDKGRCLPVRKAGLNPITTLDEGLSASAEKNHLKYLLSTDSCLMSSGFSQFKKIDGDIPLLPPNDLLETK